MGRARRPAGGWCARRGRTRSSHQRWPPICAELKIGQFRAHWRTCSSRNLTLVLSHNEIYTFEVHVITRKRLREFAAIHRDAAEPLKAWYAIVSRTDFETFADVRHTFAAADKVGRFTVFDIGGNKYRLIVAIHYNRKKVYIRHVLTHAAYDRGGWKE